MVKHRCGRKELAVDFYLVEFVDRWDHISYTVCGKEELKVIISNLGAEYVVNKVKLLQNYMQDWKEFCTTNNNLEKGDKKK